MSDVAISGLTALGGAPATGDLLVLVDVSDHTQAPTGTTKNMTAANLFTSPTITTPTLTGPTITGGLTVSSGTSAVQALTCTTITATSTVTVTAGGVTVTGNSTITGTLGGITTLSVANVTTTGTFTSTMVGTTFDTSASTAVVNNATLDLGVISAGQLLIYDSAVTGAMAIVSITSGSLTAIVYQTAAQYTVTSGTGGKINVYMSAGHLIVQNKLGSDIAVRACLTRLQ